jgi:hypothetical protein
MSRSHHTESLLSPNNAQNEVVELGLLLKDDRRFQALRRPHKARQGRQRESPRLAPGAHVRLARLNLPADVDRGSTSRTTRTRTAGAVGDSWTASIRDHKLDPEGLVIAVV